MNAQGSPPGQAAHLKRQVGPSGGVGSRSSTPGAALVPLFLLVLSLLDLRVEIQLLIDHFTFTSLLQAITSHPLAVTVLILQGSLWRRYRRR
jgi:hypothetical protein